MRRKKNRAQEGKSMKKETYAMYGDILREELLLAMGCTEPVAVAYAGAIARSVLDKPQSIRKCELYVSGNIIKNVKSVIVPNTDGMKCTSTGQLRSACLVFSR